MRRIRVFLTVILLATVCLSLFGCADHDRASTDIVKIDLTRPVEGIGAEYQYLYEFATVDNSRDYLAHPDSILLRDGRILTMYPAGHGKGEILTKISSDAGLSWDSELLDAPSSWENSNETPTVYRLEFKDGSEKLVMISANPKWAKVTGDGFNASISNDDGVTWTEFEKFYGKGSSLHVSPIVAMSSLTRLKENGEFVDKWMGLFHDHKFFNYKTILTFDEAGQMQWSTPEKYFSEYRSTEKKTQMCEVEVIRSDGGQGDELCLFTRSNKKNINSLVSFSRDEGKTWSEPKQLPASLSGERHKAEYVGDRLFITFRSIERDKSLVRTYREKATKKWYSEGWVAWVGTYDDLKDGTEGQYRMKLAHTYLKGQNDISPQANGDTGYAGLVVLDDGSIVVSSYGCFGEKTASGGYRTYIVSKRINLDDLDYLVANNLYNKLY